MPNNRPKIGLGVIIRKDNKILFGKRCGSHGDGTWSLTGGHLEFGESFEDCARRETLEEAGIAIKNVKFAGVTNDVHVKENKHYVTIFVSADYDSGEARVVEPDKFERFEWFDKDNIPKQLFLPIIHFLEQGHKLF